MQFNRVVPVQSSNMKPTFLNIMEVIQNEDIKIVLVNFLNINSGCISQWTKHQASSHLVHTCPCEAGIDELQLK